MFNDVVVLHELYEVSHDLCEILGHAVLFERLNETVECFILKLF